MVTAPPLIAVVPPAFVVILVSAVAPPTAPPNEVVPAVFTTRVCAPFTLLLNVTAWLPELVTVVAPVRATASLYVCVPVVLNAPVRFVVPPLPVETLLIPVKLGPLIVVAPLKFNARSKPPPVTVEPNVGVVPVKVVLAPRVTTSLYVCAPLVVTTPPLIAVVPPAFVVMLVSAVAPPTAPEKVVIPVLLVARLKVPFSVLPNVMAPAPALSVILAPRVTASL